MSTAALDGKVPEVTGGATGPRLPAARAVFEARARATVLTGCDENSGRSAQALPGEAAAIFTGDAVDSRHAPSAIALARENLHLPSGGNEPLC